MALGLIALFSGLGYFDCEWAVMIPTGELLRASACVSSARVSQPCEGSARAPPVPSVPRIPARLPACHPCRPQRQPSSQPLLSSLPSLPLLQSPASAWRPPSWSRCRSTALLMTTSACPAWRPRWASSSCRQGRGGGCAWALGRPASAGPPCFQQCGCGARQLTAPCHPLHHATLAGRCRHFLMSCSLSTCQRSSTARPRAIFRPSSDRRRLQHSRNRETQRSGQFCFPPPPFL